MDREPPVFADRGENYQSLLTRDDAKLLDLSILQAAPQTTLVLEYLASGRGLSVLIAHTVLGVASLTSRVAELRKLGIPIEGKWHQDHQHNRFMVYHYIPGGASHDEPLNLYSGTEQWEDDGGPPAPEPKA